MNKIHKERKENKARAFDHC
ncbi:hypothetical protein F383_10039 [Gossypium arboreum]|uniref:Uncharacterized protein n=1 Tax=Gossypium arboreum TaxID=29729 RepID=A0A0B0PFN7_GOSAR|nr:hypothetical protein F383_10039 [Gossypium arboreum]